MDAICLRVKQVRNEWELNQVEFAKRLGVTNAHISKMEKGKTAPSPALIKLICKEYKINEDWLVTGKGPMGMEDFEDDVTEKMEWATSKVNKLLKTDGMVRSLAVELEYLFASILSLDTEEENIQISYLNICHKMLYHINSYLLFQKQSVNQRQLHLLPFPDDLVANFERDVIEFEAFFKKMLDE